MTDGKTLGCTRCDQLIRVQLTYDGFCGVCSCSSYHFTVGSGDRPRHWEKLDDVTSPRNFAITRGEWDDEAGCLVGQEALCAICDDDGDVSVDFERVAVGEYTVKAIFECTANHWHDDRSNRAVAYYDPEREMGDFAPDWEDIDD